MRPIIVLGDQTSTGGSVLEGHSGMRIKQIPVALVGFIASCPHCSQGQGAIIAVGSRNGKVHGVDIALAGDYVDCGCPPYSNTLISSQSLGSVQ